jgi:hypothetical protein
LIGDRDVVVQGESDLGVPFSPVGFSVQHIWNELANERNCICSRLRDVLKKILVLMTNQGGAVDAERYLVEL